MKLKTIGSFNLFLLLKLPSAFICGVRVASFNKKTCAVTVKHRWINQNPFRSLYFAVQAMAAELSTGALVIERIQDKKQKISMLVTENKAFFIKKATGKITFTCTEGHLIEETIQKAISSNEGQILWLTSNGVDQEGNQVCSMEFCWSIKVKH